MKPGFGWVLASRILDQTGARGVETNMKTDILNFEIAGPMATQQRLSFTETLFRVRAIVCLYGKW